MSTAPDNNNSTDLASFFIQPDSEIELLSQALNKAQEDLQAEKDSKLQARFLFILAIVLLLNMLILPDKGNLIIAGTWIFELFGIYVLADFCGVQQVSALGEKLFKLGHSACDALKNWRGIFGLGQ